MAGTTATLVIVISMFLAALLGGWFTRKAAVAWRATANDDQTGEPGWIILGPLLAIGCGIFVARMMYQLFNP